MFGIGETELVLILLFAFLVFGPDKLPGMGRTLGRALRQFQNAQEGFNKVVRADLLDPAADALHEKPKRSEQLKNAASDADREDTDHQETFAERRARLKEEREAAEKAAAEAAEQNKQAEQIQEAKLSRSRRLSSQRPLLLKRLLQLHHKLRLLLLSPMILQR